MSTVNAPKYLASVFFVEDIKKSKHFYSEVLGQKIVADFGRNVGFEGGLSIWEKDYALSVIFEDKAKHIAVGTNNSEIYFECNDIEAFFE
jgi:lactoylglutathione lyase